MEPGHHPEHDQGRSVKPTDLARERRLRALDERARALLRHRPTLAARTLDYLNGRLTTMKKVTKPDTMLTMRVPSDLLARGDALVSKVAADTDVATTMGRVTRSSVLRLALLQGIKVLGTATTTHEATPATGAQTDASNLEN